MKMVTKIILIFIWRKETKTQVGGSRIGEPGGKRSSEWWARAKPQSKWLCGIK